MHDCNGKPLKPFDRVRAATKEEFEAAGHRDPLAGFDGERTIIACSAGCDTCNVTLVESVGSPVLLQAHDGKTGIATFAFQGGYGYATARTLVRVD